MPESEDFSELSLGDFERPLVDPSKAKKKVAAAASPVAEKLDAAESRLAAEAAKIEKELEPIEAYEKKLKEAGVSKEEALAIVDAVLMRGYYAEDIVITPRLKVRFRTRRYRDTQRMQAQIEINRPQYESHYNEIIFKYSLAASLERFGDIPFERPKKDASIDTVEQAFQKRISFIEDLSDPLIRILFTKLARFDDKVRACLDEGSIENF